VPALLPIGFSMGSIISSGYPRKKYAKCGRMRPSASQVRLKCVSCEP